MYPHLLPRDVGWIEVIAGCMYSGKTEELIRRVRRAQYARQPVVVFSPTIDQRYSETNVDSHSGHSIRSIKVARSTDIPALVGDALVVGIDEAQFFDDDLVQVANELADGGRRVVIAGLDLDYRGKPFNPMPALLSTAEYIDKMLAICIVCGNPADRSQRIVNRDARVLVGEKDAYEARCRKCWDPDNFAPSQEHLPFEFGRNLADELAKPGDG